MIKVVLFASALSTAIILALLVAAYIQPVTVAHHFIYGSFLAFNVKTETIGVTSDKVCYLYLYDITSTSSISTLYNISNTDLYRIHMVSTNISIQPNVRLGLGVNTSAINISAIIFKTPFTVPQGLFILNNLSDISVKVFEINKSSGIELERIIREELRRSEYSSYMPIVGSDGYERITSYVEQTTTKKIVCSPWQQRAWWTAFGSITLQEYDWSCQDLALPRVGNVHVVEICFNRSAEVISPFWNFTRLDKAIDWVANATRYNLSADAINYLVWNLDLAIAASGINMYYTILLSPQAIHIWRALAFLLAFVSGIFLHYRLRPEEYSGFIRFVRRLRRRTGG